MVTKNNGYNARMFADSSFIFFVHAYIQLTKNKSDKNATSRRSWPQTFLMILVCRFCGFFFPLSLSISIFWDKREIYFWVIWNISFMVFFLLLVRYVQQTGEDFLFVWINFLLFRIGSYVGTFKYACSASPILKSSLRHCKRINTVIFRALSELEWKRKNK